jgi:colanic acid/amylovoran biosynthesis glycosyltransferase
VKLGYVLRYWPTRSETFVAREIAALRSLGHTVDVVSLGRRADAPDPDPDAFAAPRHPRRAWLLALALRRGWDRVVVHFAGEAAAAVAPVARALGIPWSLTVHAADLFKPRADLPALLAAADPLVTVCEHHARFLRDRYGVAAHVVPVGVPLDVPRADPGAEPAAVISVARDTAKKGLDDLVAACVAVGAPLRLVSDAHRLGRPGVVTGPLAPDLVPDALARAQLFALPCVVAPDGDRDGVPVAILEAMAAGLPVVTTAVSGLPELCDEETGWIVPAGDRAALAAALRHALADPGERVRRGLAGRARVAGRTVAAQVAALVCAWNRREPALAQSPALR